MEVFTKNARDTQKFGRKIASQLKGGEVLALSGNLGSGKTTFIQGLAQGLGIKQRIISPTFILLREYEITNYQLPISNFYHIDLYRLEDSVESELKNLGIEEIWERGENVVAIEWAEKVKTLLPTNTIWIVFEDLGDNKRRITIE